MQQLAVSHTFLNLAYLFKNNYCMACFGLVLNLVVLFFEDRYTGKALDSSWALNGFEL